MITFTFVIVVGGVAAGAAFGVWKLSVHEKTLAALFADGGSKSARRKATRTRIALELATLVVLTAAVRFFGLTALIATAVGLVIPAVVLAIKTYRADTKADTTVTTTADKKSPSPKTLDPGLQEEGRRTIEPQFLTEPS
jgi:glucose uptake protein GlcU